MTMGPGGGGDPGNAGRGGRNGATGGGRGNNTPGAPDGNGRGRTSTDGRGNNTPGHPGNPGRIGNNAPTGRGNNTPGSPQNPGRRGMHAAGTTPSSRARDAMSRHARERNERSAAAAEFSLAKSLKSKEQEGTMTPRGRDMAIGMEGGLLSEGFGQVAGGIISKGISSATDALGLGKLGAIGAKMGINDASVPDNPESKYGAARARNAMSKSTLQGLGEMAAGIVGGPAAAMIVSSANTAANLHANRDIAALNSDIDARSQASTPGASRTTNSGNARQSAREAMANSKRGRGTTTPRRFEWSPVDIPTYKKGLISLATT